MADRLPFIPDAEAIMQIYGKVLPPKMGAKGLALDKSLLATLRIIDEQDAIRSMEWYRMPLEVPQKLVERMAYYRACLMFFYMKETNSFYMLPYAGKDIDVYGRYRYATALPFTGQMETGAGKKDKEVPWIDGRYWKIIYEPVLPEFWKPEMMDDCCVLLSDYSPQLSQKVIPRAQLNEPIMQVESMLIPFMRTALANGTGVEGMRVDSPDASAEVRVASDSMVAAALNGDHWIPVMSGINSEVLSHNQGAKIEEYLLALQALDNLRLSFHGLDNGGLFQKKAHMLQDEQQMNSTGAGLIMADRVQNRQEFCNIVNSIWGLGIWADASEVATGADRNMNGELDNTEQTFDMGSSDSGESEGESDE